MLPRSWTIMEIKWHNQVFDDVKFDEEDSELF